MWPLEDSCTADRASEGCTAETTKTSRTQPHCDNDKARGGFRKAKVSLTLVTQEVVADRTAGGSFEEEMARIYRKKKKIICFAKVWL